MADLHTIEPMDIESHPLVDLPNHWESATTTGTQEDTEPEVDWNGPWYTRTVPPLIASVVLVIVTVLAVSGGVVITVWTRVTLVEVDTEVERSLTSIREQTYLRFIPGQDGPLGPTGAIGTLGLPGISGPVGPRGAQGADGATGTTGDVGETGADGLIQPAGPRGPVGATGATGTVPGAQGPIGPQVRQFPGTGSDSLLTCLVPARVPSGHPTRL
jgi:hypothetical protein